MKVSYLQSLIVTMHHIQTKNKNKQKEKSPKLNLRDYWISVKPYDGPNLKTVVKKSLQFDDIFDARAMLSDAPDAITIKPIELFLVPASAPRLV